MGLMENVQPQLQPQPPEQGGAMETPDLLAMTANIVSAHVANNSVQTADLPLLIANVHKSLMQLNRSEGAASADAPAVPVRGSVKPDYIVCLEDGKKLKTLKRHLMTYYNMTPEDYRAKWKLPRDYPMVAPEYAARRRALAHKMGLGRKAEAAAPAAPKKRGRAPKSK